VEELVASNEFQIILENAPKLGLGNRGLLIVCQVVWNVVKREGLWLARL